MSDDHTLQMTKFIVGTIAFVLLVLIVGGFISSYLHGQNSRPQIDGNVACMYKTANIEESTQKEWICSKVG